MLEAKLIKREKRFFAYCELSSGEEVIAHCPNPGSMKGNLEPGSRVWLQDFGAGHLQEGKKLRYKWIMVESRGVKVVIDTLCANTIVEQALRLEKIPEIKGYKEIKREVKVGDSRFDFFLPGSPNIYLEVKSVSMGEGSAGAFPDSVTLRGQKHIRELLELKKSARPILLFLLMRDGGRTVRPAKEIDQKYDLLLREAVKNGLEVLVYAISVDKENFVFGKKGELLLE